MKKDPITLDELVAIMNPLMDEHFPKGKCKERGSAILMGALFMFEIVDKWGKEKVTVNKKAIKVKKNV